MAAAAVSGGALAGGVHPRGSAQGGDSVTGASRLAGSPLRCALAGVALAVAAAGCFDDSGEAAATGFEELSADEVLYGVSHTLTTDGVREAILAADSLFGWRDSLHTWAIGFSLRVFADGTGEAQATITAERGRLQGPNRPPTESRSEAELVALGDAVLRIPDQDREIRSDELLISTSRDLIWSNRPVVMREAGCEIEGTRFEADMSFREVKVWRTKEGDCPGR